MFTLSESGVLSTLSFDLDNDTCPLCRRMLLGKDTVCSECQSGLEHERNIRRFEAFRIIEREVRSLSL